MQQGIARHVEAAIAEADVIVCVLDGTLPPTTPDREVRVLLATAGALFFPSHYEGFGLPPVEAACMGSRIVVSKIIEKSGLKPISETPEAAATILRSVFPGTVILDGGADNRDCQGLIARLASLRSACRHGAPSVILLATKSHCEADPAALAAVDAVVAKPITTEMLQPVIDRLLERARQ